MKRFLVALALLATGCVHAAKNAELETYIAQVRARGMTDEAEELTELTFRAGAASSLADLKLS